MSFRSYVAIGDSFTEGMGDYYPADSHLAGLERGWADLLAAGIAEAQGGPIGYANLAIRGRKLGPLLEEQLAPAIALRPELVTLNGGGNDMLRPTMKVETASGMLRAAVRELQAAGIRVFMLAGADPSAHLPLGSVFRLRGHELTLAVREWAADEPDLVLCDNFHDEVLRRPEYWSRDGLHLGTKGHARVAANCLRALGLPVPAVLDELESLPDPDYRFGDRAYWREYVAPWVGRRLTGRSSGDGRSAKRPLLAPIG